MLARDDIDRYVLKIYKSPIISFWNPFLIKKKIIISDNLAQRSTTLFETNYKLLKKEIARFSLFHLS